MKFISILALILISFSLVSCGGDKEKKSSSQVFGQNLSTQTGYYNLQSQSLEVAGQVFPPNQQYGAVINQALQQAQQRNIQPIMENGVQKLRARITAQLVTAPGPYNNTYNQNQQGGYTNPQQQQPTLNISSIEFY